jgi:hypothetical protein
MSQISLTIPFLFLLIFVALILLFSRQVRAGQWPILRQIRAFEALKGLTGRAIEAGRGLHLSLGLGRLTNETTADSLAGLSILHYLSRQAAVTGAPPTVTMADPTVLLLAQNVTRATHLDNPGGLEEAFHNIRWIAPQPAAYAAGVMNVIEIDRTEANVMVGHFADEYLLMGETATRRGISHIGGTSDPNTLPFIYASADETLLGEEIYAAGAYLQKAPAHIGSLIAQDTLRTLIAWLIGIGIFFVTVT